MGQPERSLTSLGKHMAELQDQAPQAQLDRARGRARLLREGAIPDRSLPRRRAVLVSLVAAAALALVLPDRSLPRRRAVLVSLVAAAALALVLLLVFRIPDPLRFQVGITAMEVGTAGAWIAAPPGEALPIRFSDGSELHLAAEGRARVTSVSANGAEIALERGSLDLSIVRREKTRWNLRVGPFQVRVVGTRFQASWDPLSERCTISLHEGEIVVSGPVVGDARPMHAGEKLTISPATGTLETGRVDTATSPPTYPPSPSNSTTALPTAEPAPADLPTSLPSSTPRPTGTDSSAPKASSSARSPSPREASTWQALARDGKFKDALAAAEHEGFDALCTSATATELQSLGDAARLGGNEARASQAFTALRKRFPGSASAASAAFMLGRIAQDKHKDRAAAATWLETYLAEQPSGAFADEASGRLVEAKDGSGDDAGARRAAEHYLATYPNGSHAAYARTVLARAADAGAP